MDGNISYSCAFRNIVLFIFIVGFLGSISIHAENEPINIYTYSKYNGSGTKKITSTAVSKYFDSSYTKYIGSIVTSNNVYEGTNGIILGSATEGGEFAFKLSRTYSKDVCRVVVYAQQIYSNGAFTDAEMSLNDGAPEAIVTPGKLTSYFSLEADVAADDSICIKSSAKVLLSGFYIIYKDSEEASAEVTEIKPVPNSIILKIDQTLSPRYDILPDYARNRHVTFESTDENIVTVNEIGNVFGVNSGVANIIVTSVSNPDVFGVLTINIKEVAPTSITLEPKDTRLGMGGRIQFRALVEPEKCTKTVTWSTIRPNLLDLSEDGLAIPIATGQANVKATSTLDATIYGNKSFFIVDFLAVDSIRLSADSTVISVNDAMPITCSVFPEGASDTSVSWESSNPDVLEVDEQGVVVAKKEGEAVISATTNDGTEVTKSIAFKVEGGGLMSIEDIATDSDEIKFEIIDNTVNIFHIVPGAKLMIYDSNGRVIVNKTVRGDYSSFSLPRGNVYIVAVDKVSRKILL
ncbi:MAG: Ig-like domain-containing protein [Bacteroides sp.]|nr:Ig-like domain-containing protein [Bacteroides sp.]